MDKIKRNRKIIESIELEMKRLGLTPSVGDFFKYLVADFLPASTVLSNHNKWEQEIKPELFDDDALLIEALKTLGIMEAAKDAKDITKLLEKKGKNKHRNKPDPTDFDKLLKGIMKVPNEDKKATK